MANLETLPASIVTHVSRFLPTTDLLQLRATSTKILSFFTACEEAEVIWRNALALDFSFDPHQNLEDATTTDDGDSRHNSWVVGRNPGNNVVHHLQTLSIHPELDLISNNNKNNDDDESQPSRPIRTIFGLSLEEASIFTAQTAFQSWKHWAKASRIFHYVKPSDQWKHMRENENDNGSKDYINGPYFLRAARVWDTVVQWCRSEESGKFGEMLIESLQSGVRRSEGRFPPSITIPGLGHTKTNFKALHAFEALFAFCGGQWSKENVIPFFGMYEAYDHENYTKLVGTKDGLQLMKKSSLSHAIISHGYHFSNHYSYGTNKCIGVNLQTGELSLLKMEGTLELQDNPVFTGGSDLIGDENDIGLLWMEEHAMRLKNGHLGIGAEPMFQMDANSPPFGVLSAFPSIRSPKASRRVTNGIEVVASSLPAIEIGIVVYSVRIRVLTEGEDGYMAPSEREFDTCQLYSRHWKFCDGESGRVDEVSGPGVVGRFPLLREGGYRDVYQGTNGTERIGTFQYQSAANIKFGTFEGKIAFIPGSIRRPTGPQFFVHLGSIDLTIQPDILY